MAANPATVCVALGPNINKPMDDADVPAAWPALQGALRTAPRASAKEQALVRALATRYVATPVADRKPLDRAYADAISTTAYACW